MIFFRGSIFCDYEELAAENGADVDEIVKYTANTWQPNRGAAEKRRDAEQGKRAEKAVALCFSQNFPAVRYLSYDKIRSDNFQKHAPFDGLLFAPSRTDKKCLDDMIGKIRSEIASGEYGTISAGLRADLCNRGIYTLEIKSTAVNDKKRAAANFRTYDSPAQTKALLSAICEDDFLTYPHFLRVGSYDWQGYCRYVRSQMPRLGARSFGELEEEVKQIELANMDDFYIRVYMDDYFKKAIVLGFLTREEFMDRPEIKKMILRGKSERALYFAKSLTARRPLGELVTLVAE